MWNRGPPKATVWFLNLDDHTAWSTHVYQHINMLVTSVQVRLRVGNVCLRVLQLFKMQKAPCCSNRKGFFDRGSKGPFHQKRMGLILRTAWGRVRCSFACGQLPTLLSWLSSSVRLRSAPPWFWEVKTGWQERKRDGGPPHCQPEESRTAGDKSMTQWGWRGNRENDGPSSPPERTNRCRCLDDGDI